LSTLYFICFEATNTVLKHRIFYSNISSITIDTQRSLDKQPFIF